MQQQVVALPAHQLEMAQLLLPTLEKSISMTTKLLLEFYWGDDLCKILLFFLLFAAALLL
jgi:hypothetical protein